ncbi:putative non-specific serine/threonine protein kinase [Rosa chinensis]|uniref:Putative non-specific serine/threonine protein kinase n=1 Tax=Rosa chinensis TaxID=74649 RepID=A0A2P6R353_ROSCH|nr:putative non-specific serine/threonine protein kinase [Rosa chinensis]
MDVQQFVEDLSTCSNSSLEVLDFMSSNLHGSLPESLGSLKYLESELILGSSPSHNRKSVTFAGPGPGLQQHDEWHHPRKYRTTFRVESIATLGVWGGSWEGVISEIHLHNLSSLISFSLSSTNSLVFHVSLDWTPPFNLLFLSISDCKLMNPAFPMWLRNQSFLDEINFSNVGISDSIPDWFWKMSQSYYDWWFTVDLSDNQLRGRLPSTVNFCVGAYVNLNTNFLEGSLPLWQNVTFSGPIPTSIGEEMPKMVTLDLSS